MKPIITRLGSKSSMLNDILPMIPDHKTYVEPFFGGGAVFFAKQPALVNIINDIDSDIISFYNHVKNDDSEKIIDGFPKGNFDLQVYKDFVKQDYSDERYVASFLIKTTYSYMGLGFGELYDKHRPIQAKNKLNRIGETKALLKDTIIHNETYEDIIDKYDDTDTFFFLDPPYEVISRKKCYTHNEIDLNNLCSRLKMIKGKFILTINNSDTTREIFKSFNLREISIKSGVKFSKKNREELIITNF